MLLAFYFYSLCVCNIANKDNCRTCFFLSQVIQSPRRCPPHHCLLQLALPSWNQSANHGWAKTWVGRISNAWHPYMCTQRNSSMPPINSIDRYKCDGVGGPPFWNKRWTSLWKDWRDNANPTSTHPTAPGRDQAWNFTPGALIPQCSLSGSTEGSSNNVSLSDKHRWLLTENQHAFMAWISKACLCAHQTKRSGSLFLLLRNFFPSSEVKI